MGKRSRRGWRVLGWCAVVFVALAVIWSTQDTGEEIKRRSVDKTITLTGEFESDGARLSEKARLETSAEEKVTRVHVTASRRGDSVRAPIVDVTLTDGTRCQTPTNWAWSRDPMSLVLVCERYLSREEANAISAGEVAIFEW